MAFAGCHAPGDIPVGYTSNSTDDCVRNGLEERGELRHAVWWRLCSRAHARTLGGRCYGHVTCGWQPPHQRRSRPPAQVRKTRSPPASCQAEGD